MKNIILKKINTNYGSDPNIAEPTLRLDENNLKLVFPLNYMLFDFKEGQKATIEFKNVTAFRCGTPNDEGFDLNDNKVWNREDIGKIDWHSFYEVTGAPKEYLDSFYKIDDQDFSDLKHYVFFMKEGTFECLAKSYKEMI